MHILNDSFIFERIMSKRLLIVLSWLAKSVRSTSRFVSSLLSIDFSAVVTDVRIMTSTDM